MILLTEYSREKCVLVVVVFEYIMGDFMSDRIEPIGAHNVNGTCTTRRLMALTRIYRPYPSSLRIGRLVPARSVLSGISTN